MIRKANRQISKFERSIAELSKAARRSGLRLNEREASREIAEAVACGTERDRSASARLQPAATRALYKTLLRSLTTARCTYEGIAASDSSIDPLVWATGEPDWQVVKLHLGEFAKDLQRHENWVALALDLVPARSGRPRGRVSAGLPVLINMLADCWDRHVERTSARSRRPGGGKPYGPFIRFVLAAIDDSRYAHKSENLEEYVAKEITTRRKVYSGARRNTLLDRVP